MQSQQLLMKSPVFEDEVVAGAEIADYPPDEMPERQDHLRHHTGTRTPQKVVRRPGT